MAVGQIFIDEPHPTALHKAIEFLGRGAPFCFLKVFAVGGQAKRNVPSLNDVGKIPSIPLRNKKSHGNNLVIWTRSLYSTLSEGFWLMSWKSEGGGLISLGTLPGPLEEALSILVLDDKSQSLVVRQSAGKAKMCRKSGVIWQGDGARALHRSWDLGELFPQGRSEVPLRNWWSPQWWFWHLDWRL